jgi:RHS repeat-associated protein
MTGKGQAFLWSEGGVTEKVAVKSKRMEIRPPAYTERIATKRREERTANNYGEERRHVYYYHGDHLGSAQVVTDYRGEVYEHIEYTPYGELWVEHAPDVEATPFRFTGKERDSETGLYYYGARYLNPQTGMWLSTDPAMGEYIPQAPLNDEARKYNGNLPGMGGIFNTVNLHAYHYAGNNPVKYTDPEGEALETPWDIANAVLGYVCAYIAFRNGNYLDGAINLLGAAADTAAAAIPGIPGGASTAIKVTQYGTTAYSALNNIVQGIKNKDNLQLGIGVLEVIGMALGKAGDRYLEYAESSYNRISKLPRSMIYGAIAAGLRDEHIGIFFKAMSIVGVSADTIKASAENYSVVMDDMKNLLTVLNYQPPSD